MDALACDLVPVVEPAGKACLLVGGLGLLGALIAVAAELTVGVAWLAPPVAMPCLRRV